MRVHLSEKWAQRLRSDPETGMGYQIVDGTLRSGLEVRDVVVLDAEEANLPESAPAFAADAIADVRVKPA